MYQTSCCFITVYLSDGLLFLSGGSHRWLCSISPTFLFSLCCWSIRRSTLPIHPPGLLGSLRFQTPPDWSSFQTLFILWLSLVLSSWDDAGFSSSSKSEALHECINSVEPRGPPGDFFLSLSWKCGFRWGGRGGDNPAGEETMQWVPSCD